LNDQLQDNRKMIWQILPRDFGQISAKPETHRLRKERKRQRVTTCLWRPHSGVVVVVFTWPGASPSFSAPWSKNHHQRNNISVRRETKKNLKAELNAVTPKNSSINPFFNNSYNRRENCVLIKTGYFEEKQIFSPLFQGLSVFVGSIPGRHSLTTCKVTEGETNSTLQPVWMWNECKVYKICWGYSRKLY
jgi:hypothetical protein